MAIDKILTFYFQLRLLNRIIIDVKIANKTLPVNELDPPGAEKPGGGVGPA